ncbi:glycogen debranching protein GlgX [Lichenihabitans psoromatis]|uniref:glycogen debranching protein GlgX n=1 Tax=Lichenihabitans psoromatis TaxID=2528642 RepID=UPI00103597F8|nr:glycogen debranching protein GlgX [Lichenihabitans psoromatis]
MSLGVRRVSAGSPEPLGVTLQGDGLNVAVFSANADAIDVCLFDETGDQELERIRLFERTGNVFHAHISGVVEGARYGLRAHGPYDPGRGHRFNSAKLLIDPHALALDRPFVLHPSMYGFVAGSDARDETDSAFAMPKGVVVAPTGVEPWRDGAGWPRTVISELHVRGYTKLHPGVPEALRGTFAGLASPAGVDHLVKLGITTVELMPAAAWIDERHLPPLGLTDYWGYNPVAFSVPDLRLAPGGWAEVRAATAALNAAGIEVVLDVVYNHTGESDELGPTLSLRGLDNASYYRLRPDNPALYINDSACGNILAADRAPVVRLVLDSLRNWARLGGINGFRFDLATTLGRRAEGFEQQGSLLTAIEQDPLLRNLKLVAEPWDMGPGGYRVGGFSAPWAEWNDRYRDAARRFWRGDAAPAELAPRVTGSADLFWAKRRPSRSINFITAHDGFTLRDLVSYTGKRNDRNGEQNRDGGNQNWSWNCSIEGETDDHGVNAGRLRDQRNLLATLLLSRGTPMLGPSVERGLTQGGNNNAYAQDNETAWTDWSRPDELSSFIRQLIAIRLANPAITADHFLTGDFAEGQRYPDIEWRRPDGQAPQAWDWEHPATRTLIEVLNAEGSEDETPNRVTIIHHSGFEPLQVILPEVRTGHSWRLVLDTAEPDAATTRRHAGESGLDVAARSVVALVEEPGSVTGTTSRPLAPELVDRLASAAGIAPDWSEMNGVRHVVTGQTKLALLTSMGLAVGSSGEVRDSLDLLSQRRERRLLPASLVAWEGQRPIVRVAASRRLGGRLRLAIAREDGSSDSIWLNLDDAQRSAAVGSDGRPAPAYHLPIPSQPIGRHRLWVDSDPTIICALTVAPSRCYLPPELLGGHKAFGIAAHLYTLRSAADQGIGDFSTLARFADAAGRHGAELVGLNPLHALFAEHRDRASPYHPSDRRYLDPIYIDVTSPDVVCGSPLVKKALDDQAGAIAALRALKNVAYPGVWSLKKTVLRVAFDVFDARRKQSRDDADIRDFESFARDGGTSLAHFAAFMAIEAERQGQPWWEWPEGLRRPEAAGIAEFAGTNTGDFFFQIYLQWLADRQFGAAAAAGRAAGLNFGFYRDLAVGTANDGAESWANQGVYATGVSVGAPPDAFSANGQTWALPPPNPAVPGRAWLDTFATLLAANMRHAGALRIDHAMGLSRLFWIPDNAPGSAGAYVHYPMEEMIGELSLESHRAKCLVIGEDLGTVAPGFRDRMAAADILSYRVVFFEREKEGLGFDPASAYPEKAVACVSTHDLPTLSGWWHGLEIEERRAIGSFTPEEADKAEADRAIERVKLAEVLGAPGLADNPDAGSELVGAIHRFVGSTPSMLVMAQADDLVGERVAVNLPGTDNERPNWRRRLDVDVSDLFELPLAKASLPLRR